MNKYSDVDCIDIKGTNCQHLPALSLSRCTASLYVLYMSAQPQQFQRAWHAVTVAMFSLSVRG